MAIVKSKLLKQLSYNYPNFLKKDLEKFTNIILVEIKRALKEEIELSLEVLVFFPQRYKKLGFQGILELEKRSIHHRKKLFTLKCQKTCLKN